MQQISSVVTVPMVASSVIVLASWLFASRYTVNGALMATGGIGRKHYSAFHCVFATAR